MRSHRLTALAATALATLVLAGCTTESQVCKDGTCKISMSGKGATAQLGGEGGSTIELISASGDTATVKIASQQGELHLHQPISLDNATLELTEVKDNKIKLEVKTTGKGSTPPDTTPSTSPDTTS